MPNPATAITLINLLMQKNEEMRVIAVGDDDQNIYSFRGSDSKYLNQFIAAHNARKFELIQHRIKDKTVEAVDKENGKIKIVR